MVTIKDIAKIAGVSHGTVSNVLNKKGNVSAKKIALVEKVAQDMGYNINKNAKSLRQGIVNNIALIIPNIDIQRYRDLYKGIASQTESKGYVTNLYLSNGIEKKEKEIIAKVLSDRVQMIVIISCLYKKDDFYNNIKYNGINLIFVERKVNISYENAFFYSYDAVKIGKDVGKYIVEKNYENAIFFSNRKTFSFENDIFLSFTEELNNSNINITQHSCDSRLDIQKSFDIIFSETNTDAIITTSKEKAIMIRNILNYKQENTNKKIEIIALSSTKLLHSSDIIEYELNYHKLGSQIGKMIISNKLKKKISFFNDGMLTTPISKKTINKPKEVNILCIEGLSEKALRKLSPIITSISGIKVNIISYKYDKIFEMINQNNIDSNIDLIRIDMSWLSSYGKSLFTPLKDINYNFNPIFRSFIDGLESEYSHIEGQRYSFPFDPSMQILFYRKDLFEDAIISRTYFEKYKEELKPPTTFEQFNRISSFFTRKINGESQTLYGTTLVTDTPQALAGQFLPIYYSNGGEIIDNNYNFKINEEILRLSLNSFKESFNYASDEKKCFWEEAMNEFILGDAAMCITFSNRTSNIINSKYSNVLGKFDYSTLPNNNQLIGGGCIGISKKSTNIDSIVEFLELFYSKKISLMFSSLCGSSSSKYVCENSEINDIYPWINLTKDNIRKGKRRYIKSDVNELSFEYNLGKVVKEFINDTITLEDTIKKISDYKNVTFTKK